MADKPRMPTEPIVASVVEVPRPERPTLYGFVWRGGNGWGCELHTVEHIRDGKAENKENRPTVSCLFTIPASNAPPAPRRMTEAECRERIKKWLENFGDWGDLTVDDLVAFARSLGILEGT